MSPLADFGWGGGESEFVKKGKFVKKIFFSDNVELSSENLWKMISVDVTANKKKQETKDLASDCILEIFIYKKYF